MTRLTLFLTLLALAQSVMSGTEPSHSHESIRQSVQIHILQRSHDYPTPPKVEVSRLDRRLKLHQCDQLLETYEPPGFRPLGRTTVGVRCKGTKPWSLLVPVAVSVDVEVVVSARDLSRGEILQAGDLKKILTNTSKVRQGYLDGMERAVGKKIRRNIARNTVLNHNMLKTPKAVKRGNIVTIVSRSGPIEVRMKGKAVSQGGIGERIAVLNLSSNRRVEGIIVSPTRIEIR